MTRKSKIHFGNCIDCQRYARLDGEERCQDCARKEIELVDAACHLLRDNPKASRDDIAEALNVQASRVEDWMRQRKIRTVAVDFTCEHCGKILKNSLTCDCRQEISSPPSPKPSKTQRIVFLEYNAKRSPRKRRKLRLRLSAVIG
ncbi:MAG: hypothetical protein AB1656_20790 [Candidatus Omnitrophota bacterium]